MNGLQGIFERNGYLVVNDFFDTELMIELDPLIRGHSSDASDFPHSDEFLDKAKTDVIPWFPQREGEVFDEIDISLHPRWLFQKSHCPYSKQYPTSPPHDCTL